MRELEFETCFVWCLSLENRDTPSVSLFDKAGWGNQPVCESHFHVGDGMLTVHTGWDLTIVDLIITQPWVAVSLNRPGSSLERTFAGPAYAMEAARQRLDYTVCMGLSVVGKAFSCLPSEIVSNEPVIIAATIQVHRI